MKMVSCTVLLLLVYISTLKTTEAGYYGSDESPEQYGYTNYDRSSEEGYGGLSIKDDVDDVSLELAWLQPKSTGKTACASARKQNRRYKRMQSNNIDCTWNQGKNILPAYPPVILRTCSNKIVLPVQGANNNIMRVQSGTDVSMSCPGTVKYNLNTGNTPNSFTSLPGVTDIRASCNNGILTNVQGNTVLQMSAMGCKGPVQEEIRFLQAGNQGALRVQLMAIGFRSIDYLYQDYFYQQIILLLDNNHETTLWTKHILQGANLNAKESFERPPWKEGSGSFSSPKFTEEAYGITSQKNRFTFIQYPGDKYFARGHLAPAADFVTKAEFDATFQFVNALPQWQQINNGNWGKIEQKIRDYAVNRATDLRIITGGYGNLKDSNGNNMYLGGQPNSLEWPIPGATWKIVIKEGLLNTGVNEGVAFVVSNDPFSTNPPAIPNANICHLLTWIGPISADREKGHTYCLSLGDFKQIFNTIPSIDYLINNADANAALLN